MSISCVPIFNVAVVLHKAEKLLKVSIQPYISSILDALMEPTSRGFSEVRDVFFRELVDMSKNTLNEGTKETVAQVRKCRRRQSKNTGLTFFDLTLAD